MVFPVYVFGMFSTTVPAPDLIKRMVPPEITEFTVIVFRLFERCRKPEDEVMLPPVNSDGWFAFWTIPPDVMVNVCPPPIVMVCAAPGASLNELSVREPMVRLAPS